MKIRLVGIVFWGSLGMVHSSHSTAFPRIHQPTIAERLATKYDAQAQALSHSSGRGYQKVPRRLYRRYSHENHRSHRSL